MTTEKMTIAGISATAPGQLTKAGKPMNRGQVHTMAGLAPAYAEGGIEKGQAGTSYECDPEIVRRIAHLNFPVVAEVTVETVLRFGERTQMVTDVKPANVSRVTA